jgi:hypothetical protein
MAASLRPYVRLDCVAEGTRATHLNGESGVIFYEPDGRAAWVARARDRDGVVVAVRSVLNPDKLLHVAPR